MGTARSDVYELLKTNLLLEDAVAGEAAGLAMGLVMLGTGSVQAIEDMVQVCRNRIKKEIKFFIDSMLKIPNTKRFCVV
jgi:26S proteasome regulatory subunit N2